MLLILYFFTQTAWSSFCSFPQTPRFPHSQSEPCYPTPLMHVTCSFPTLFLYANMQLKTNFPSLSLHSLVFACKCHLLVVTWHAALTFCSCLVKCTPVQFSVKFVPFCCPISHLKYPVWSYSSLRISQKISPEFHKKFPIPLSHSHISTPCKNFDSQKITSHCLNFNFHYL